MSKFDYLALCIKDISGEIKPREKAILSEWLNKFPENQKLYNQYKTINNLKSKFHVEKSFDKETGWKELDERISRENRSKFNAVLQAINNFNRNIFSLKYRRLIFAVGILFLILCIAIPLQNTFFSSEFELIITQNKEKRTIILPDQSEVILNSGSSLEYPKDFNHNERSVQLNGEGFFTIRKNSSPFIVNTINASITVLGTQFNVWARLKKTRVIVKEGSVQLSSKKNKSNAVKLLPDQMSTVVYDNDPKDPEYIDSDYHLGWLQNKLIFEKTPLSEAVAEIERFFDVSIKLDQNLNDKILTARFVDKSVEPVLEKLCLVFDAKYSYQAGVFYFVVK